jgi:hypothetical protein
MKPFITTTHSFLGGEAPGDSMPDGRPARDWPSQPQGRDERARAAALHGASHRCRVIVCLAVLALQTLAPAQQDAQSLQRMYALALERSADAATQSGKATDAAALLAEKALIETGQPIPNADATTPVAVATLRRTYLTALKKLSAAGTTAAKPVLPVAKGKPRTDLEAAKAMAQWVITQDDVVMVTNEGKITKAVGSNQIPNGRFSVTEVYHPFGSAFESTDFPWAALPGLGEVTHLHVKTSDPISADHTAMLTSLPLLERLCLRGRFQPGAFEALPSLPTLQILQIYARSDGDLLTQRIPALVAKFPNIWQVHVFGHDNDRDARAAMWKDVAGWTALRQFHSNGPLDDVMAEALEFLPITYMQNDGITDASALVRFKRLQTYVSSWTKQEPGIIAAAAQLQDIVRLETPPDSILPEEVPALRACKQLRVVAFSQAFGGVERKARHLVSQLAQVPQLTELNFKDADLQDADLLTLGDLKNLERLGLKGCKAITDAGVKAFLKKRPRCKVVR